MGGKLENKNVIITGGSVGIGHIVARCLAKEGATIFLIARHEKDLKQAIGVLDISSSQRHEYFCLDVSDTKGVKELKEKIEARFLVHGLVNCAGVYGPIGKTHEIEIDKFITALGINLIGTLNMCHYFIPLLMRSGRGKVVNFAGGGAASAFPNYSAYAVSKVAVVRFTENMGLEYADSLDVNAVSPGFVVTRIHDDTLAVGGAAGTEFLKKTKE